MENHQLNILLRQVEAVFDREVKTPKDFDALAKSITEHTGQPLSTSTLKRLWGYTSGYSTIRTSTLDVLALYAGHADWHSFCQTLPPDIVSTSLRHRRTVLIAVAALLVAFIAVGGLFMAGKGTPQSATGDRLLHCGQLFPDSASYLSLFGIEATDSVWWDQPLPHSNGIFIWGPQYGHPQWHNEGNRDSLMPTITEYWTPASDDADEQELAREKNRERFFTALRFKELRITFMRNLTDSGYVFLGIYRVDPALSDSTRLVWQRLSAECDLSCLADLEQLRQR